MSAADVAHFRAFGFVVLRQVLDAQALATELARSLRDGCRTGFEMPVGAGGHFVPMMCERTPVSLSLLDRFAGVAELLLEAPVLPVREGRPPLRRYALASRQRP